MTKIWAYSSADLVAAAAPILGYAPTHSIVTYLLRDDTSETVIACTTCFDIAVDIEDVAAFPTRCGLADAGYQGAILLAICDPDSDSRAGDILETLRDALHAIGIPVTRRLLTRDVTTAAEWVDTDTGERDPTRPYTDSVVTAQFVHAGQSIRPSRDDIAREFDPITPAPTVDEDDDAALVRRTLEEVAAVLAGQWPGSPTLPARAGMVITAHPGLCDAMLYQTLGHERAAADLWTGIARQLRGRPRAEALTVAAVCHCLLSDMVRAQIAVDTAVSEATYADTEPPQLAVMLVEALQSGVHPSAIRRVVAESAPRCRTE